MKRGLRLPLVVIFTLLIAILLGVLGLNVSTTTARPLQDAIQEQVHARAEVLANLLARAVAPQLAFSKTRPLIEDDVVSVSQERGVLFVVVKNEDGQVVRQEIAKTFDAARVAGLVEAADRAGSGLYAPPTDRLVVQRRPVEWMLEASTGSQGYDDLIMGELAPQPAEPPSLQVKGSVYVALSKESMLASIDDTRRRSQLITLAFVAGAVVLAFLITFWVTRPLGTMLDAAVAMSRGEYQAVRGLSDRIVEVKEIGVLAEAFAAMRDQLAEVAQQARRIAEGDLSQRIEGGGELGDAFNAMVSSLSNLVGQIKKASLQIASSSSQILAASKQAEKGSAEQASSIAQTTTTMDQLLSASKQIASSADAVVQIAERTLVAAKGGEDAVGESIKGMTEIAENNRQTAERTLELSERNQEIGNVVDLIDDIADKSDLLALNAAIEGAKAGEAGKGFAVVATEMRALAENVISSTKEIKGLISEIQKASNASVLATEGQMKATERGTMVAQKTVEHLQEILQMVVQTTEAARQISLATQQQRTGTEQVVQSMSEIAKIAKSNVAGATQTTSSTVELASLADELRQAVSRFQLGTRDG